MTLQEAEEALSDWYAALKAASTGISYSIGGRSLTRADISDIRDMITYWKGEVNRLAGMTSLTASWR